MILYFKLENGAGRKNYNKKSINGTNESLLVQKIGLSQACKMLVASLQQACKASQACVTY